MEPTSVRTWGKCGTNDGEFARPISIAVSHSGNIYVADYVNDRIQCFNPDGKFIHKWGKNGNDNGEFNDPTGIAIGMLSEAKNGTDKLIMNAIRSVPELAELSLRTFNDLISICVNYLGVERVYITDTNNNRVQVFEITNPNSSEFIYKWGSKGEDDGKFYFPYRCALAGIDDGDFIFYVLDLFNHRIQAFSSGGKFICKWGSFGDGDYQFLSPTGICVINDKFSEFNVTEGIAMAEVVEHSSESTKPSDLRFGTNN